MEIITKTEEECKCMRISGHLEAVRWLLWPRDYRASPGHLALNDWARNHHYWLHYVESNDGLLTDDDVLKSTDTRYWSIHDVQRYFLGDLHCEKVLFTYQYPNLRMSSHLGSYLWRANTALKLPPKLYQKEFNRSLEITLKKMEATEAQMDKLIVSDQLIKLDRLDYFKRKTFFRILMNIMSFQDRLQLISFENLCCTRLEGTNLIHHIACFNSETLKYLFLWRFVQTNENPLLINYSYITGSGQYIPRPETRQDFLRSLGELRNLRILALEYSHIADGNGNAILSLLPVIKRPHFRLQEWSKNRLLWNTARHPLPSNPCTARIHDAAITEVCLDDLAEVDDTPGEDKDVPTLAPSALITELPIARPSKRALLDLPNFRIRDYDNIRRFLTPSIPLRETHLQYGIDMKIAQRQDSDISCFVRHIAHHYSCILVTLSIHQWQFAVFPLRRVFELMPHLVRFFYVGKVQDDVDLKRMLEIISCGVCDKLKQVNIQIEDEEIRADYWRKCVDYLTSEYADICNLYDINFCLGVYKH